MAVYAVVWYWLFFASLLEILNIQWNSFVPNDLIVFGWRFALDVSPIRDDDIFALDIGSIMSTEQCNSLCMVAMILTSVPSFVAAV
eukprot:CAMPEP_0202503444 /NCGR_PEP_ID=MMETSP1361-20130828/41675_1 /ASSEMBLY_ACC=CAM_ASM_000849 /TAXON_ID=210615 /ORGANISM="Staurosira complex sp., Strain CCMP2646" /LENGTH=85 /DNA_ID=CAMNT_0049136655 /DNA_START=458 /DNA_END=716 /DNA_ORIENTATION=-